MDFTRLKHIEDSKAFFVIRAKEALNFTRVYSNRIDKSSGLRVDQTITLGVWQTHRQYPDHLRRIKFFDSEHNRMLIFLTNNFALDALVITQLYHARWHIELFFKWIKQHLRIKAFYGNSPNAVRTQIWIAVSMYVLVAIIKKELGLDHSLYTILQILSVTLFQKEPIFQVLTESQHKLEDTCPANQLSLFNI
jgi:IS4 transposase